MARHDHSVDTPVEAPERRVYVIDDDRNIRKSLEFLLGTSGISVQAFDSATAFIDQLLRLLPAPILLDVRMPGIDGMQLLKILKDRGIDWPVVMITAFGEVAVAVRAMQLGSIDFLEKPIKPDVLEHLLDKAFAAISASAAKQQGQNDARELIRKLSQREREVMQILMEGAVNKVAAHQLGLSARTVEMHRANALTKLDLRSIAQVIKLFQAAEFLTP
jgi:two-component system, LuxR family, response regulator FixJ